MTPEEWASCVLALRSYYPTSFKLDATGVGLWYDDLKHLPGIMVTAAIKTMAARTPAFPSLSEILQLADPQPGPDEAWGEFIAALGRHGYCGTPEWSDPVIPKVVHQLGGWVHVCQTMLIADLPTWRAQFRRAYEATAQRMKRDEAFLALGAPLAPKALPSGEEAAS